MNYCNNGIAICFHNRNRQIKRRIAIRPENVRKYKQKTKCAVVVSCIRTNTIVHHRTQSHGVESCQKTYKSLRKTIISRNGHGRLKSAAPVG